MVRLKLNHAIKRGHWWFFITHEKQIGHRDCSPWAHGELTVTKMVTASRDWAVT